MDKHPNILDEDQKRKKISNLLSEMSKRDRSIKNGGSDNKPGQTLNQKLRRTLEVFKKNFRSI